jgi:isocitrate/isopropylmalate dehydrogenase
MSSTHYTVACLARHGTGPELMAEASRAIRAASLLHGFEVDEEHVPFGTEALMRFGHPFPPASRRSVLAADAVLVPPGTAEPLDALEIDLDVRATAARVRFGGRGTLSVLAPVDDDGWAWTLERAFVLARSGRARVALAGVDERWSVEAEAAARRHDGVEVERLSTREVVRRLVAAPERFDVLVCPPELATAAAELAACTAERRIAAWGRLADSGPSVFGPADDPEPETAGLGVADPSSMLLAAALMLGEGLGERTAAATLSSALGRAQRDGVPPSTRGLADTVLAELPSGLGIEFQREAV